MSVLVLPLPGIGLQEGQTYQQLLSTAPLKDFLELQNPFS